MIIIIHCFYFLLFTYDESKRGRAAATVSKEELIDDLEATITRSATILATANSPTIQNCLANANAVKVAVDGNANHMAVMLQNMSDEQLLSLNTTFGGSGGRDYKTGAVKNIIFNQDLKNLKGLAQDIESLREVLSAVAQHAVLKGLGNEKGEVPWSTVQASIVGIMTARARQTGPG